MSGDNSEAETGARTGIQNGMVSYADFGRIDIRVGRITRAETFPKARDPAYKLWIDFGDLGIKQSSAQTTKRYQTEALVGRHIAAVVNFPPKNVAGFVSEVLVLGVVPDNGGVVLLAPDFDVAVGTRIS